MRVLVLTDDRLGPAMAGSALRAWEIGRALTDADHDVVVCGAAGSTAPGPGPEVVRRPRWGWADAILAPAWSLPPRAFLGNALLIVDGATPLPAELETMDETPEVRRRLRTATARLPLVVARADILLAAGRAQMNWWAGLLGGDRPEIPILDVPFGLPEKPPPPDRAEIPGVPGHHAVVLWWGGVWPWLDLDTLLAARARLGSAPISVVVPVAARPGSDAPIFGRGALAEAMERYGLRSPWVVPLEEWVPYAERHRLLNRASLLAVFHRATNEAALAFRTRALDGLWAGVPLLLSEGGEISDLAHHHGWGAVIRPGDVVSAGAALELMLKPREQARCRENLQRARPWWSWRQLVEPLVEILPTLGPVRGQGLAHAAVRSALILAGVSHAWRR